MSGFLDDDLEMQRRIERVYGVVASGRPRPGPSREDLLDVMNAAVTG